MKPCRRYRGSIVEAAYGELDRQSQKEFEEHLRGCRRCSEAMEEVQATFHLLAVREREEPDPAVLARVWEDFTRRQRALEEVRNAASAGWSWRGWFSPRLIQTAAAILLVVAGVWVGRLYESSQRGDPTQLAVVAPAPVSEAQQNLNDRVDGYLRRSKTVLLGMNSLDTRRADVRGLDLTPEKEASRELIEETHLLKQELELSRQQEMVDLISELELLLLQISNLEEGQNVVGIQMVQSGVHRGALLLKINLEEVRLATRKVTTRRRSELKPVVGGQWSGASAGHQLSS